MGRPFGKGKKSKATRRLPLHLEHSRGRSQAIRLVLEPMRVADVEEVTALDRLCFPEEAWPAALYRSELGDELHCLYLVVRIADDHRPGSVVANAGCRLYGDQAQITTIATHPEWRRHRIAEWLLLHLLRAVRDAGVTTVTLEVRESNAAAQGLYRKHGFVVADRVTGYYEDEAALVLALFDLDDPYVWQRLQIGLQHVG